MRMPQRPGAVCVLALVLAMLAFMPAGIMTGEALAAAPGAASSPGNLRERYPQGHWTTLEQAERALVDVKLERQQAEAEFDARRRVCYTRFFATACIKEADVERRERQIAANAVEIEAERYQREVRATDRAQSRSEAEHQRLQDEALQAEQRAANARAYEQRLVDHAKREAERVQEAGRGVTEENARRTAERAALLKAREERLRTETRASDGVSAGSPALKTRAPEAKVPEAKAPEAKVSRVDQQATADAATRRARAEEHARKLRAHEAEQRRRDQEEARRASNRRITAEKRAQKVRDAETRQANMAKKRAENEAAREKKRAEAVEKTAVAN